MNYTTKQKTICITLAIISVIAMIIFYHNLYLALEAKDLLIQTLAAYVVTQVAAKICREVISESGIDETKAEG